MAKGAPRGALKKEEANRAPLGTLGFLLEGPCVCEMAPGGSHLVRRVARCTVKVASRSTANCQRAMRNKLDGLG